MYAKVKYTPSVELYAEYNSYRMNIVVGWSV